MSKFKQFFIRKGEYSGDTCEPDPFYSVVSETSDEITDPIHVIEYAAFEKLLEIVNQMKIALIKIQTRIENRHIQIHPSCIDVVDEYCTEALAAYESDNQSIE